MAEGSDGSITNYPTEQNPYGTSVSFHLTRAVALWGLPPMQ